MGRISEKGTSAMSSLTWRINYGIFLQICQGGLAYEEIYRYFNTRGKE